MNKQREAIYSIRRELLEGADQREYILELANDILMDPIERYTPREKSVDEWDVDALRISVGNQFGVDIAALGIDLKDTSYQELSEKVSATVRKTYEDKEKRIGPEYLRYQERMIMLQVLDSQWKDHLWALDHLKEGIGLRGYGQRDPLIEYKKESFDMFEALNARIEEETVRYLFLFEPISAEEHERARAGARGGAAAPDAGAEPRLQLRGDVARRARRDARSPRSAATIPARAGAARNSKSATVNRCLRRVSADPARTGFEARTSFRSTEKAMVRDFNFKEALDLRRRTPAARQERCHPFGGRHLRRA